MHTDAYRCIPMHTDAYRYSKNQGMPPGVTGCDDRLDRLDRSSELAEAMVELDPFGAQLRAFRWRRTRRKRFCFFVLHNFTNGFVTFCNLLFLFKFKRKRWRSESMLELETLVKLEQILPSLHSPFEFFFLTRPWNRTRGGERKARNPIQCCSALGEGPHIPGVCNNLQHILQW